MRIVQKIFGFLNNQSIVNNNIVVDETYLNKVISFQNNPSDVNFIVLSLYNSLIDNSTSIDKLNIPPAIDEKIKFNNVIIYKSLIEENFSENGYYLDSAYDALDYEIPGRKKLLLKYIHSLYLSVLGEYLKRDNSKDRMDIIKSNADNIITKIINLLLLRIEKNTKTLEHISIESIEYNVIAIVCHAFVDCKILENPNTK